MIRHPKKPSHYCTMSCRLLHDVVATPSIRNSLHDVLSFDNYVTTHSPIPSPEFRLDLPTRQPDNTSCYDNWC